MPTVQNIPDGDDIELEPVPGEDRGKDSRAIDAAAPLDSSVLSVDMLPTVETGRSGTGRSGTGRSGTEP